MKAGTLPVSGCFLNWKWGQCAVGLRTSVQFSWLRKVPVYYDSLVLVQVLKISVQKAPPWYWNSMKLFDYIPLLISFSKTERHLEEPLFSPPKQSFFEGLDTLASLPHESAEMENSTVHLPWFGQFHRAGFERIFQKACALSKPQVGEEQTQSCWIHNKLTGSPLEVRRNQESDSMWPASALALSHYGTMKEGLRQQLSPWAGGQRRACQHYSGKYGHCTFCSLSCMSTKLCLHSALYSNSVRSGTD